MPEVFERIIEKLEAERSCYFLTIANTGDKSFDVAYEKVGEVIDKAIEIVKQEAELYREEKQKCGDWQYSSKENIAVCPECRYEHYLGTYHQYATYYCPNCGKRMKPVH